MAAIDYDKLNAAAQMLFDEARRAGERAGRDAAAHESVEHVGRGMLGMAGTLLDVALGSAEPNTRRRLGQAARNLYGRTPGGPGFDGGRLPGRFGRVMVGISDIDRDAAAELRDVLLAIEKAGR